MRIGLPRALFYHEWGYLFEVFLRELGEDVVLSPETNKEIVRIGVKYAHSDTCYPVKVAYGHIYMLKDKCDAILLPYMRSIAKYQWMCPKFIAFPDYIRAVFDNLPQILSPTFHVREKPFEAGLYELGKMLGKRRKKIKKAIKIAMEEYKKFKEKRLKSKIVDGKKLRIGVVARSYIVYDKYVNLKLFEILGEHDVEVHTSDNVPYELCLYKARDVYKRVYYSMAERNLGAAYYFLDREDKYQGMIYVVSFQCGPDAMVSQLIESKAKKSKVSYLPVVVDEHASEVGLRTRIEAFLTMLEMQKKVDK